MAAPPIPGSLPINESTLNLSQVLAMLKARRKMIVLIVVLTAAATAGITFMIPKSYTARVDMMIDYRINDPITGKQFHAMLDESYLQTQLDILTSLEVAGLVVDKLGLLSNTERGRKLAATKGVEQAKRELASRLIDEVRIVTRKQSRVVEVFSDAESAEAARDRANAFVQNYIEVSQKLNLEPAKARREQYSRQLESLRQEADAIQRKLTEYQQQSGIIDDDERVDTDTKQLNDMTYRLVTQQAESQEVATKRRMIETMIKRGFPPEAIPEITQRSNVMEIKGKLTDIDRQIAEASEVLGNNHPKLQALRTERATLQTKLRAEAQSALDAVMLDYERAAGQERALSGAVAEQQKRILEIKRHRDVIASYIRQRDSIESIYKTALQKYDELLMASQMNQTNLAVLHWAEKPMSHSRPHLSSNIMMSLPVGLLLGIGIAFLMEMRNRRLRSLDDLEREFDLPVQGRIGGGESTS